MTKVYLTTPPPILWEYLINSLLDIILRLRVIICGLLFVDIVRDSDNYSSRITGWSFQMPRVTRPRIYSRTLASFYNIEFGYLIIHHLLVFAILAKSIEIIKHIH